MGGDIIITMYLSISLGIPCHLPYLLTHLNLGLLLKQLDLKEIAEHHVRVLDPRHEQMVEPFLGHCFQSFLLLLLGHCRRRVQLFLLKKVRVL